MVQGQDRGAWGPHRFGSEFAAVFPPRFLVLPRFLPRPSVAAGDEPGPFRFRLWASKWSNCLKERNEQDRQASSF